jgi:predicted transcriptional regulator
MLGLQRRLHKSKQDLYDKIKLSKYDKQTKIDAHKVVQELKTREKDIVVLMRNVKVKIDETKEKIQDISDEIEEIKRRNRRF